MAHLGQRDRKDPQNPVFVRYITNNKDWEKLTIKTENGQFADMYRKEGTSLVEMDVRINPRTEVKLLKNEFEEIDNKKYVEIEYTGKKGFVLISKLRKPTDQQGRERPPKLDILAEHFTEGGHLTHITVLTQPHVEVMSFTSFDQLKRSVIDGAEKKLGNTNSFVIEKIKTYLDQTDLTTIDLNGIDDSHIDELGIYFGEVLVGILAFKNQLKNVTAPSDMLSTDLRMFAIPTDPAFKLVDSVLMYKDNTTVSVSSKYGAGAAASFMTNVLPYGMKYYKTYDDCFFKKMCKTATGMGFTSEQVGGDRFAKSKNIMMEVGIRDILGLKTSTVKNTNHSVYHSIKKIATGKDVTPKENQELDEVIGAVEEYFEKRKGFSGGSSVITTIRDNYPVSIPTFFNYTVSHHLENDSKSKTYVENIIGGKSFYQANLDKSLWRKGEILIKMVYPKSAKLKILGSMSSAVDYTTKHGMINYELK